MTIRIEVQPDGQIEIMRPRGNHGKFTTFSSLDTAIIIIKFYLRREIAQVKGEMFVSQATKEARKAFKQLSERNPYGKKT
jgi:hypothetical protein